MSMHFDDAATAMLLTQPFFGTLLMKYQHVEDRSFPTLCVTPTAIRYNPDFIAASTEEQRLFCIAHEIMHACYAHLDRIRHYYTIGMGPDGHPFDAQLYNKACDYVINDALRESKVGEQYDWVCWSPKYPYTMTPEEVYCDMRKNGEPQPKGGKSGKGPGEKPGGSGAGNETLDEHDFGADQPDQVPAVGPAEIMEAANVAKMTQGKLPAGIDRLIGDIRKPDVSPWARLRQAIVTAMHGRDATSWNRLQRRMIVRGIGLPGPIAHGSGKWGIVADTSGSIDAKMLNLFGGHMAAIMDDAKPREARIYWTDAKVHRVDTVRSSTDLRNLFGAKGFKAPGGGGTDMPEGVEAAFADGCDMVAVLTDGYTPFGQRSKKPVIWAITSPSIKAPHGKSINIS
jgi:predicted metal-dependent peptidase